ncbi:hypothetical protein ACFX13_013424 [Malus domestica]
MRRSNTWTFLLHNILHLLDKMLDIEVGQEEEQEECNLENNLAHDAPGKSSTTFKEKDVSKEDGFALATG